MMSLLASPLAGFAIGFFGAVGVGPLNIAVITQALRGKPRTALAMITGGVFGDVFYCSLAMLGLSQIFMNTMQSLTLRVVSGVAIVLFGVLTLARASRLQLEAPARPPRFGQLHNSFWIGLLLSLLNPYLILSWAVVAVNLHAWGIIGETLADNLLFAVGAGTGVASWLLVLLLLLVKNRRRIPYSTIRVIVRVFGVILIAFGFYCMFGLGFEKA